MVQPDFERANQYALKRLIHELSQFLTYHGLSHTLDDVLPGVERLARQEGVQGEDLILLRTAACYHDLGFIEQYQANEPIGVRIAAEVLPGFGYAPGQVQIVAGLILATRIPQTPNTKLEEIMADADLDSLGRTDYWEKSAALRAEQALFNAPLTDGEWYTRQLRFLQVHRYFTQTAINQRETIKQQHIIELQSRLKECEYHLNKSGQIRSRKMTTPN